jgi:2,4-dienoyl-CoA reductase-like NADH-dependent reductase (Old Yellow Enzyme family)
MLFAPLTLRCGLTLPNRVALAPLTNWQSDHDGLLGEAELAFLARRAEGGFGLVSTCAAYVAQDGKAWAGELGVDRDDCIPGLSRVADAIHRHGAKAVVQLFHGGARAEPKLTGEPVWSATAWTDPAPNFVVPRPATLDDITRTIDRFIAAAVRSQRAGFDGVELHGAHGYVLSQFLSRTQNTRRDGWGSTLDGRARMLREAVRGARRACGRSFAIGVRLSFEDFGNAKGQDLDDNLQVAQWLAADGADFIHASLWDHTKMSVKRPASHVLTELRAVLPRDVAIFTAGKIWTHAEAEAVLARGADVVALGRSGILNPAWPRLAEPEIRRPPMTRADLADRAVSKVFQDYLTNWKNFVAD